MSSARRPNFVAFIATGVVLGFVVGSAVAYFGEGDTARYGRVYSPGATVMFLGVLGACVFGLVGAILAVLLDRRE